MGLLEKMLDDVHQPTYVEAAFDGDEPGILPDDIPDTLRASLEQCDGMSKIGDGDSVAIAVGSREIKNLPAIVRTLVSRLKQAGAKPFIIPAMGSHGGATAKGQTDVLAKLGIDEDSVLAPVCATMDTVLLGQTISGMDVYLDKNAYEARWLIPVGRVKLHTDFRGAIESGVMKMLVIGAGKQKGAETCHARGWERMSENIVEVANVIMPDRVPFGIAIVENGSHDTCLLEAIAAQDIASREPVLLERAKRLIRKIPFEKVDVLVLECMGKDISGSGMDPNVIGRSSILGRNKPDIDSIAVFDLTEASHNNATGVGKADVITRRLFDKIDLEATYLNGLTGQDMRGMQIPVVMPTDRLAYLAALKPCWGKKAPKEIRVCWMRDTLHAQRFYISQTLAQEATKKCGMCLIEEPVAPSFDDQGNFIGFFPVLP